MPLTVACAQFAPVKAEVARNLDRVAEIADQAAQEGADLVVFPETCTTGYFLEGGVLELAMPAEEVVSELGARVTQPVDLIVGYYEKSAGALYNSAVYLQVGPDGAVLKRNYRKFFLPTYGVFDEQRFVGAGNDLGVFDTRLARVGILICEDIWHAIMPTLVALRGCQLLAVPAASPARGFSGSTIDNHDRYLRMLRALCEEHGMFAVDAQLVGFEGGKGFVGGSAIVDPFGRVLAQAPIAEEALILAELDLDLIDIARAQAPLLNDLSDRLADVSRLLSETER